MLEMKVVSICLAKNKNFNSCIRKLQNIHRKTCSIGKPVLLDFESLSTIFWQGLLAKTHFPFSLILEVLEFTSLQALAF